MPWRGAGVAVPVFSIRSEADLGVGEFLELKLLVDWSVESGFHFVQFLPINDTYPYRYHKNFCFRLHKSTMSFRSLHLMHVYYSLNIVKCLMWLAYMCTPNISSNIWFPNLI